MRCFLLSKRACISYFILIISMPVLAQNTSGFFDHRSVLNSKNSSRVEPIDYTGYGVNFSPQCDYSPAQIDKAFSVINNAGFYTLQLMGDFDQVDSGSGVCLKNSQGVDKVTQQQELKKDLVDRSSNIKNISWVVFSPFDLETASTNGTNIDASA